MRFRQSQLTVVLFAVNSKKVRNNQIFIMLAVIRRSMQRISGGHLRGFAPGQHRRSVTAVASRCKTVTDLIGQGIEPLCGDYGMT